MKKKIFDFGYIYLDNNKYSIFIEIIKNTNLNKLYYNNAFRCSHFNLIGNNKRVSIRLDDSCYCKYGQYYDELSLTERRSLVQIFESTNLQKQMYKQWNNLQPKYKYNSLNNILIPKQYLYIWDNIDYHSFEQIIFSRKCSEWAKTEYNSLDDKYEFLLLDYFNGINKYGPHIWLHKKNSSNEYTAISLIDNKYIDITKREYYPCTYQYEKWKYKYNLKQFYLSNDECMELNKKMNMKLLTTNNIFFYVILQAYYSSIWEDQEIDNNTHLIPNYTQIIRE